MMETIITMQLLNDKFAVCRLNKDESTPQWAYSSDFYSISKTSDELSIVCKQSDVPTDVTCEKEWRVLKILGPLDFSLIGILSKISRILADESIGIFVVSTFDTDYILVKNTNINKAVRALANENYKIID